MRLSIIVAIALAILPSSGCFLATKHYVEPLASNANYLNIREAGGPYPVGIDFEYQTMGWRNKSA
jgi:hypothetical protein